MNLKKSELAPTQDLVYIGARFCMDLGRHYLLEIWIQALTACVRSFTKVGAYKPAPISEAARADGSYAAISGKCPPPHESSTVVPEAPLDPCNPRVASSYLCQQGSGLRTPLVVRQAAPVSGNVVYIPLHNYHYHYGCEHGGMGLPPYCAWVRYGAVQ